LTTKPPRAATRRARSVETEGVWQLRRGATRPAEGRAPAILGREGTSYSNPYRYTIERVWWDGRIVYASEQGELDIHPKKVKVAQEYQIVYSVRLDGGGSSGRAPSRSGSRASATSTIPCRG